MKTQLPEHWQIKVNDSNRSILEPYWRAKAHKKWKYINGWLLSHDVSKDKSFMNWGSGIYSYTTLTTEEFKTLVLNKQQILTYEIY